MTENDKGILKRLGIVIAVLAVIGALIGFMLFPPLAVFILLGGILIWIICFFFLLVSGYLFK